MTFPKPAVQEQLAKLSLVALDVDDVQNVALRERYGDAAVPAFAMIDAAGDVVHRWVGGGDATAFLAELKIGHENAADPAKRSERQAFRQLLQALAGDDDEAFAEAMQRRQAQSASTRSALLWSCCQRAKSRRNWRALANATRRYLAEPDAAHRSKAQVLAGIASFERQGAVPAALQQRIDALIDALAEPFPGSTIGARLGALLGKQPTVTASEADAWVDRANATMASIRQIGPAAAPSLRLAMRTRVAVAQDCAILLAGLRLPDTTKRLREELRSRRLPAWTRAAYVACIASHKEERCLPVLLAYAARTEPAVVRAAAVWGLRDQILQFASVDHAVLADAIGSALRARDRNLRCAALQAAMELRAALPLDALQALLEDRRIAFAEFTIADNALWLLLQQLGRRVVDADGEDVGATADAIVVALVQDWLQQHGAQLQWSAERAQYRVR